MDNFKKCKVVLLSTPQNPTPISIGRTSNHMEYHEFRLFKKEGIYDNHIFKHLYILSKDKLKKGDLVMQLDQKRIFEYVHGDNELWFKIIASTDKSLNLDNIPEWFIKKFVDSYNDKNIIENVSVEFDEWFDKQVGDRMVVNKNLFGLSENQLITIKSFNHRNDINVIEFEEDNEDNMGIHISHTDVSINELPIVDDNNCINITSDKEIWNREEVKQKMRDSISYALLNSDDTLLDINNWIEENL